MAPKPLFLSLIRAGGDLGRPMLSRQLLRFALHIPLAERFDFASVLPSRVPWTVYCATVGWDRPTTGRAGRSGRLACLLGWESLWVTSTDPTVSAQSWQLRTNLDRFQSAIDLTYHDLSERR